MTSLSTSSDTSKMHIFILENTYQPLDKLDYDISLHL